MDYVVRPPMLSMCCNDPNFLGELIISTCMIDISAGAKTGRSRVGGPKLCVMDRWVTGDRGHDVYPGSGPLDGGETLGPALLHIDRVASMELI